MPNQVELPSQEELNKLWHSIHPELPDYTFKWSPRMMNYAGWVTPTKRLLKSSIRYYLEHGIEGIIEIMKHEAAHVLAWEKHKHYGHGKYFWYYLGKLGATRYCKPVSLAMQQQPLRMVEKRKSIKYDPESKTFRQE